jgi:hypothetical protein
MTRGNLTTFSISNDIAKYFAIIPASLLTIYPQLETLNVMRLASPFSAILSAVIFNAIIIPLLIPLALRGTKYRPMPAQRLLIFNLLVYGVGGILAPFVGIKAIDRWSGFRMRGRTAAMKDLSPRRALLLLTVICIYPRRVTVVASIASAPAAGFIRDAAALIARPSDQPFSDPEYLARPRPRPFGQPGRSAAEPRPTNPPSAPNGACVPAPARSRDHRPVPGRSRGGSGAGLSCASRRRVLAPSWRGSPGHGESRGDS